MKTNRYIIKWGILGLKRKDYKVLKDKEDFSDDLKIDNFVNIFNKSQYIFDVNVGTQKNISMMREDGIFKLFNPICLSVKIPKREIEKSSLLTMVKDKVNFGTEFNVLYNGYLYVIFRKIDQTKKLFEGEFFIRKILNDIIKESKNYEPISIPPTPFREEIFIDLSHDNDIENIELEEVKDNNIIIKLPNSIKTENFFFEFYDKMNIDFNNYFRILECVKELEKIESNISKIFVELSNDCLSLQNLKLYNVLKKYEIKKKIKVNISKQFIYISEYQRDFEMYRNEKDKSIKEIQNNLFFKDHINKFEEEIQYNGYNFEFIHTLIDYSKDVLVSHEGNVNSIIGVILGGILAIIGIIIGKMI